MSPLRSTAFVALFGVLAAGVPSCVSAPGTGPSWPEVKCERYAKAWSEVLTRRGTRGLGQEFIDRHNAFVASGCTARADVCPRSADELDVANIMVLSAMNAGMASTFPPFACRR